MSIFLHAYGCGSPIRLPIIQAISIGAAAKKFIPDAQPDYLGGDSIVWGLIRGAQDIMIQTRQNGCDFFQVDNAYFGRNLFFRVTENALQHTKLPSAVINNRHIEILNLLGHSILPWKINRNGPIVICPSSEFLYRFYGTDLRTWTDSVVLEIRKHSNRPILIRHKALMPNDNIDEAIHDAWCVVTHVSAAALDALRLGIPVSTTGDCAASPFSTPINEIENPRQLEGRESLFSLLANSQFTVWEMQNRNIIRAIKECQQQSAS